MFKIRVQSIRLSSSKRILAPVLVVGLYAAAPILLFVAGVGVMLAVLYLGRFLVSIETTDSLKSWVSTLTGTASVYVAWRIARWLRS